MAKTRVALGLLCGLAVCCTVMYLTADAGDVIHESNDDIGSGRDTHEPRSIKSVDVEKTGLVYTKTPDTLREGKDGRERLLTFLDKVEANIAKEVESRKKDIAAIRAQMAKNMAFNAAARSKMKKMLLKKMAENAKIAKDDLAKQMRWTQKKFADTAEFENKRNKNTIKRSRKTREIMSKNKAEGAKALKNAVDSQQRALAALDAATNEKIRKTNKHIGANAAQIKENAKKARSELDKAMNRFDSKMRNVMEEARKGRSRLAAQAAAMDKKFRDYANNKIKAEASKTAAQFAKVRDTMAKDRAAADAALSQTSAKMDAALNAAKALQDNRFAKTVSDIAAAKAEANKRVKEFTTAFKADILSLATLAEEQSTKLNKRVSDLSQEVTNNRLEQAKVNSQVDAELKRMVALGNKRYKEHLDKDKELHSLMEKNKEATAKGMMDMSLKFYSSLEKIKKQMKKDRAHAEARLSKQTTALFDTIKKNKEAQDTVNKQLTEATRAAEVNAARALKATKEHFTNRLGGLTQKVKDDEQKHNGQIMKLTGVVAENAIKDAKGREELKKIAAANKAMLKKSIHDAVAKGESRAKQLEKHVKDMNKKTQASMNSKITTEISKLAESIHGNINELQLQTKEARAQMKKEIMEATKEAATLAKQNLKKVIAWSEGEFTSLHAKLQKEKGKSEGERAALSEQIEKEKKHAVAQIGDAVAAQTQALLALELEQRKAIKKTNKQLTAHAKEMEENAAKVAEQMKANTAAITASLEAARKHADTQLASVDAASVARYNSVVKAVEDGIAEATKEADIRFVVKYKNMAKNRQHADEALAGAVNELNEKIASAAALEDARFSKTVKDLSGARKKAREEVEDMRHWMKASLFKADRQAKAAEISIVNQIQKVSGMIVSDKAAQARANTQVKAELARLIKFSDQTHSNNKRARGVIKKIMDENKAAAAAEVKELAKHTEKQLKESNHQLAGYLDTFKTDLTQATDHLYGVMAKADKEMTAEMNGLTKMAASKKAAVEGKLVSAKKVFNSRLTSLTNAITANSKAYEAKLSDVTGVVMNWKKASVADRKAIEAQRDGMVAMLEKNIERAVSLGEAQRKAVEDTAMANIAADKKTLLTTISASVEKMADNAFAAVQGNRAKIADNYLSLKAYTAVAADLIEDYLEKGKTRNLASIGDLLETVAGQSTIKTLPAAGEGFGAAKLPMIFSGKSVKVDNSISKINGLVSEYMKTIAQVKNRWRMGLGRYLIAKIEIAMQGSGALEVDKVEDKSGNYVFINAHAVGLSAKLSDFQGLAVRMTHYENALAKLTGKLTAKKTAGKVAVGPPEWQGD